MHICVPAIENQGVKSRISNHFGSAPFFMIVDSDTGEANPVVNENLHHGHGGCQPLRALAGHVVDAVVVGGIGMGAMMKLQAAGIRVYLAEHATVEEVVAACKEGKLTEADASRACAHHGHGHHDHEHHDHGHGCGG